MRNGTTLLAAIFGSWGTHYDVAPASLPEMALLGKWFLIGLVPQLTIWLPLTVVIGAFLGIVAGAIASRRPAAA